MPSLRPTTVEQLGRPAAIRALGRRNWWPPSIAAPRPWPPAMKENSPAKAASGPWARTPEMARLEAVLLLSREPLSSRRLAQLARLADGTQARTLIRRLARCYEEANSAFAVAEIAGGFQLLTRPKFGGWLRRMYAAAPGARLSRRPLRHWPLSHIVSR